MWVVESARRLPVAYDVDVVVVGGSTGAVAAAAAAAEMQAKVFLAAPRPYLGEDMAGTLRLWLEEGETPKSPFANRIFAGPKPAIVLEDADRMLPLKYEPDLPSAGVHKDTKSLSKLTDGEWSSASQESVQYDGDVTIVADLGAEKPLAKAYAMVYHRKDFMVGSVTVHLSSDRKIWREGGTIENTAPAQESDHTSPALPLSVPLNGTARYVRYLIKRAPDAGRILVGELVVIGAGAPTQAQKQPKKTIVTPLHVKRTLDEALLTAGVDFLFSCYATDVLRDSNGRPAGIVMVNRAGRQAVVSKVIVDATDRAWVARMAGADFSPFPSATQVVKRVVIGGEPQTTANLETRQIQPPFRRGAKQYGVAEYTMWLPLGDGGYESWAEAEQIARDRTYHPDQQFASDMLWHVPPDQMKGRARGSAEWRGVGSIEIQAFRPANVERMLVLGGCADIPRDHATKLLRPTNLIEMGTRIGQAAAIQAKAIPALKGVKLPGSRPSARAPGDVSEFLAGARPGQMLRTIQQEARGLPVLGSYDVVVIGGGTAGAPASIAAARQGAKTLVVECLHGLGGVGTLGAISKYYWGNRVGFTKEVAPERSWSIEQRMELWRKQIRDAGGHIWFGALGCGALVDRGRVTGAVVATPQGRGVVLAKVVIDGTGNSDVAAAAGAPCIYTDGIDIALQGTGLPPRILGRNYTNTDYTITDETDMHDVWHLFVYARAKAKGAFDLGQLIDTRERRRIVGDSTVSVLDQLNQRTYPDTIVEAYSNFDTHGYTTAPYFTLIAPDKKGWRTHIPYRALLPKGLDGILVIGLGISAHRDAVPVIRMQPDIQNGGYAAGVAAATVAKKGIATRDLDIRELQRHLVEIGNLPEAVLTQEDSYPLPSEQIEEAVRSAKDGYRGVSVILADPGRATPFLRHAHDSAEAGEDKLTYAHILAVLGDPAGLDALIAEVVATPEWDQGWRFKAGGQFGSNMSRLDRLIYALGRTRDRRALPAILDKVKQLTSDHAFSHHRAVALALESIADPSAAQPLADLLAKPDLRGHTVTHVERALAREKRASSWGALAPRRNSLRELMLARALHACGDKDGVARQILDEYAKDLRGHFARHAQAVVASDRARHNVVE